MAEQLRGYKKERPLVLGQHTPLSIAKSSGRWKDIPYLQDNDGMLPPNMIVVGDRRRVLAASRLLYRPVHLEVETAIDGSREQHIMMGKLERIMAYLEAHLEQCELIGHGEVDLPYNGREHVALKSLLRFFRLRKGDIEGGERLDPHLVAGMAATTLHKLLDHQTTSTHMRHVVKELLAPAGRVDIAVGIFIHENRPIPLAILETQMGMGGQDINAWEAMAGSMESGYDLLGTRIPSKAINVIRAGTCGGIIIPDGKGKQREEPFIDIGDVIVAQSSIADGAVVRQRAGFWTPFDTKEIAGFREFWAREGFGFTEDGNYPVVFSSRSIIEALDSSCRELKLRVHHGSNMSKESLYLEGNEERTMDLRKRYYSLSTEMEHFDLAYLTHELTKAGIPANNGLVSTVVGTVPGGSFAEPGSEEERYADEVQSRMLNAVMVSLWKLARS